MEITKKYSRGIYEISPTFSGRSKFRLFPVFRDPGSLDILKGGLRKILITRISNIENWG